MARSNSIQFLRGNNISGSGQTLLPGQPAYDLSTGYLYVGKGSTIASTSPVKASYANQADNAYSANTARIAYGVSNTSDVHINALSSHDVYMTGQAIRINGSSSVNVSVNGKGNISFPQKSGTVALTSDIKSPTVTNNGDGTVNITFD